MNRDRKPIRIGDWVLRADRAVLQREDEEVRLMPKALAVLLELIDANGKAVAREILLERVWGATYPSDQVVSRALADLRAAFQEDTGKPRYFRTIPKYGYQLITPVTSVSEDQAKRDQSSRLIWPALLILAGVIFTGGLIWWLQYPPSTPVPELETIQDRRPLTSAPGLEHQPRFSPDGEWVLYARLEQDGANWDLHRITVSSGENQVVANAPDIAEHGPAFSPDGKEVAYIRYSADSCHVVRQALPLANPVMLTRCARKFPTLVDWSPDGHWIAYTAAPSDDADGRRRIYQWDLAQEQAVRASDNVTATGSDFYPRYSPDGSTLAFLRGEPHPDHRTRVWVVDLRSGNEIPVTDDVATVGGMAWIDDTTLLVSMGVREGIQLQVYAKNNGQYQYAQTLAENLIHPDIHLAGRQIVAAQIRQDLDLTIVEADGSSRMVARSNYNERNARFSPDGQWLAFVSERTGFSEVWLASVDGTAVRRLTRFEGARLGQLAWHPDGKRIAFEVRGVPDEALFVVNILSGKTHRLDLPYAMVSSPSWIADDALVFGCGNADGMDVCVREQGKDRILAANLYRPQAMNDGAIAAINADGDLVRFLADQPAPRVVAQIPASGRAAWHLQGQELVFLNQSQQSQSVDVVIRNLVSGEDTVIIQTAMPLTDTSIDVNPVTGALVFSTFQSNSDDLVLLRR